MITLLDINVCVFDRYMKDVYLSEDNYPILIKHCDLYYRWLFLEKETSNITYTLKNKDKNMENPTVGEIQYKFGEKIDGFITLDNFRESEKLMRTGLSKNMELYSKKSTSIFAEPHNNSNLEEFFKEMERIINHA